MRIVLTDDQIKKCEGEGFIPLPKQIKVDATYSYYKCPFCVKEDHYATMVVGSLLNEKPIHCHHSGRMAWVKFISEVIMDEEIKFRKLLDRFSNIQDISPEDAVVLWHTHGCPIEILEDACTNLEELRRLIDEHNNKGKSRNPKTIYDVEV